MEENPEGRELIVKIQGHDFIPSHHFSPDDSIAVNGVCQTITRIENRGGLFHVQVVHVTLEKTTLKWLRVGDEVNLERPLTLADPLGGHLIQGHVNGVAELTSVKSYGENRLLILKIPSKLCKYVIEEGSIAFDGVSLTVASVAREKDQVMISIIPHTWQKTNFKNRLLGDKLNMEVDVLAKYVENLLFYKGRFKK